MSRYGGLGDRHQQNGVNYTLDLNAGLTQVLADGTNTYLYGNGRIAQVGSTTEYFLGDALGSVRQLAAPAGTVTLTQSYAPYGEITQSVGTSQTSYGFTNEFTDPNGLVYLRARYYAPTDGRFISRDTWAGDYNRPLSLNRWNYVEGNPVNKIDPTGHYAISSAGHNAVPVQPSAQAQIYSTLARTGSQEVIDIFGCSGSFGGPFGDISDLMLDWGKIAYYADVAGYFLSSIEIIPVSMAAALMPLCLMEPASCGVALELFWLIDKAAASFGPVAILEDIAGGLGFIATIFSDVENNNFYSQDGHIFAGKDTIVAGRNMFIGLYPETFMDYATSASQLAYDQDRIIGNEAGGSIEITNIKDIVAQFFWEDTFYKDIITRERKWWDDDSFADIWFEDVLENQ